MTQDMPGEIWLKRIVHKTFIDDEVYDEKPDDVRTTKYTRHDIAEQLAKALEDIMNDPQISMSINGAFLQNEGRKAVKNARAALKQFREGV